MNQQTTKIDTLYEIFQKIRQNTPLVHCLTNTVTVNDCANILLAAGASPTMAHHEKEVVEVTSGCKSLVCNLGATEYYDSMLLAATQASQLHHPLIIDPVGICGSTFRRNFLKKLLHTSLPSCIRGNAAEIAAFVLDCSTIMGVDAAEMSNLSDTDFRSLKSLVMSFARKQKCIVIISGATDFITNGEQIFHVKNGSPFMQQITGAGCMSSALLGAFLAEENSIYGALSSCLVMGICGEIAATITTAKNGGTMRFHNNLIDQMSLLSQETFQASALFYS